MAILFELLERPWYGHYVVMLTSTDSKGRRYRHPVAWFHEYHRAEVVYDMFLNEYYRGKMHRNDDIPVIVDYTGWRKQKLPKEYNHVLVVGDLSTL